MWRRKIDLYRKQGNHVEADRLLKRINQIYPQDTVLHRDLVYSMELNYQRQKRAGDRKTAILTLEELLKSVPDNEQYYLDIINLHLQEGEQEQALAWTSRGLAALPGSVTLVYKKVGILSEMNRHPEALAFMRDRMRRRSTPELQRLYSTLVLDAARAERQRDPYVLYARPSSAATTAARWLTTCSIPRCCAVTTTTRFSTCARCAVTTATTSR